MREEKGWNADRHGCRTCKYRARPWNAERTNGGCDYILIVGKSRGCEVEDCDKYIKGKLQKAKEGIW